MVDVVTGEGPFSRVEHHEEAKTRRRAEVASRGVRPLRVQVATMRGLELGGVDPATITPI
jgi:hypothetical protein